jgi:hypothetical protein
MYWSVRRAIYPIHSLTVNEHDLRHPRDERQAPSSAYSRRRTRNPEGFPFSRFYQFRVRRPFRAGRSGGTHASRARWRALIIELGQTTMANILNKSHTPGSRARRPTHTTHTTIELIQCSNIQDTAGYMSSLPHTLTTPCRNITPPTTITTRS